MDESIGVWANRGVGQNERVAADPARLTGDPIGSIRGDTEQTGKLSGSTGAGWDVGPAIQQLIRGVYTGPDDTPRQNSIGPVALYVAIFQLDQISVCVEV